MKRKEKKTEEKKKIKSHPSQSCTFCNFQEKKRKERKEGRKEGKDKKERQDEGKKERASLVRAVPPTYDAPNLTDTAPAAVVASEVSGDTFRVNRLGRYTWTLAELSSQLGNEEDTETYAELIVVVRERRGHGDLCRVNDERPTARPTDRPQK